jgi:hypothetical protein
VFYYAFDVFAILFHQKNPRDLCTKSSEVRIEAESHQSAEESTEGLESLE